MIQALCVIMISIKTSDTTDASAVTMVIMVMMMVVMIMLSELRQRKINVIWYHLYVESKKKKGTNEVICKTETESHTAQTYGYQKGGGGERLTKLVGKIDYQQRPTVQHRELYSIFHNNL